MPDDVPTREVAAERERRAVAEPDKAGGPGESDRPPRGAQEQDGHPEPGADPQEHYPD